jgi:UDP-N-acetylglucosamine 1-carboxyvinyltransferase
MILLNMSKNKYNSIDFEVNGGKKLSGSITTNFSKNGSVGLLCASLLNRGKTTLHGIARIEEVFRVIEILESIGVKVKWIKNNSLTITPPEKFNLKNINVESAVKTRSIIMTIGPLIHYASLSVNAQPVTDRNVKINLPVRILGQRRP